MGESVVAGEVVRVVLAGNVSGPLLAEPGAEQGVLMGGDWAELLLLGLSLAVLQNASSWTLSVPSPSSLQLLPGHA